MNVNRLRQNAMTTATAELTSYDKAENYLKSEDVDMVEWIADGLGVSTEFNGTITKTVNLNKAELIESLVNFQCNGEVVSEKVQKFLTENYVDMTLTDLKKECKKNGIKTTKKVQAIGIVKMTKAQLIDSILKTSDYSLYF
jgi:hypothetical protein